MAKRKRRKTKKSSNEKLLKYIAWVLAFIAALLAIFLVGYFFGYSSAKDDVKSKLKANEFQTKQAVDKLERAIKEKDKLSKELKKVLKNETKKYDITAAHEVEDKKVLKPIEKKVKKPIYNNKPKLAIIFDDVSFGYQVKAIKSLNLNITMSFFPPSKIHPNTPKLASKEKFYMIHLPMEAMNFHKEEPYTLRVGDSLRDIQNRIEDIKELFPRVKYINNHTGSKFTSDRVSVKKLLKVLEKNNIKFIDSRTTAKTKVPEVQKEFGHRYLARDVFLDHYGDVASIKKQIKLAVKLAKKYGYAIAIGHPHPNTIKALKQMRNYLKNEVDLVYINQL
jgi:polysaccharide deacetylase 2 family uncharacterized protein YibQ